jgi:hypothetical protein
MVQFVAVAMQGEGLLGPSNRLARHEYIGHRPSAADALQLVLKGRTICVLVELDETIAHPQFEEHILDALAVGAVGFGKEHNGFAP